MFKHIFFRGKYYMINAIGSYFMTAAPYKQRRIVFGSCLLFWFGVAATVYFYYH